MFYACPTTVHSDVPFLTRKLRDGKGFNSVRQSIGYFFEIVDYKLDPIGLGEIGSLAPRGFHLKMIRIRFLVA